MFEMLCGVSVLLPSSRASKIVSLRSAEARWELMTDNGDETLRLTTNDYWAQQYSEKLLTPIDPEGRGGTNYSGHLIDRLMKPFLENATGGALIEVGCGGSTWLPFFARRYEMSVAGIDYTESGCDAARRVLSLSNTAGTIVNADLFDPPTELFGKFDIATSFGVVEHFAYTSTALRSIASLCRPGGYVITTVPTMKGLYGAAVKATNRPLYDLHHPMNKTDLAQAHVDAGLVVKVSKHLLGLPVILSDPDRSVGQSLTRRIARTVSHGYIAIEKRGFGVPPNRFTSPYAICVAQRPQ